MSALVEVFSVILVLAFYAFVGWVGYRIYRAIADRVPALDRAVNGLVRSPRTVASSGQGKTALGITYLWALSNHYVRYRRPMRHVPIAAEEPRYLDAA